MRNMRFALAASLLLGTALPLSMPADAQTPSRRDAAVARGQAVERTGQVYLIRGLFNVFSLGMDELTEKLQRRGYRASVHGHAEWEQLADRIAQRVQAAGGNSGPVVLIGHSLGGDAIMLMAERLGRYGISVDLIIAFDPTKPSPVPANVRRAVNLYQANNGWGVPIRAGAGFSGQLENVDLSARGDITHTSIDKANDLHAEVIRRVQAIGGSPVVRRQTAAGGSAVRRPTATAAPAAPTTQRAAVRRAPGSDAVSASSAAPAATGSVPAAPPAAPSPPAAGRS